MLFARRNQYFARIIYKNSVGIGKRTEKKIKRKGEIHVIKSQILLHETQRKLFYGRQDGHSGLFAGLTPLFQPAAEDVSHVLEIQRYSHA